MTLLGIGSVSQWDWVEVGPKKTLLPLVPKDIENSESLANKQARVALKLCHQWGSPRLSTSLGSPPGTCWGKKDVPIDEDIVCAKLYALLFTYSSMITTLGTICEYFICNLEMGIQMFRKVSPKSTSEVSENKPPLWDPFPPELNSD